VVAVGVRIADPKDPLGREARAALCATSGLSAEGVELALRDHLETSPSAEHVDALCASVGASDTCFVLLSANVCTASLRAIALGTATAPHVVVRPSRRDPTVASLLVRTLTDDADFARAGGTLRLAPDMFGHEARAGDEVHLYGRDETLASIAAALPPGVVVRAHGTGLGVAIIGACDTLDEAAAAVARDVVPFDQRGCLSPRAVLVEGDAARASAFARALHAALARSAVPRGALSPEDAAAIAVYRATVQSIGEAWEGEHHLVGLDPAPRALVLPPAARVVHVVPCADGAALSALLAPWAPAVTTIGADAGGELARSAFALAPRARVARLGEMQRPPLDGPVDRRRV
jgi:hypothetical protein